MENLLSSMTNIYIDWAAVNNQGIAGRGDQNVLFLLAWQLMIGIEVTPAVTTYQEWYEARADVFLIMFSNYATAQERGLIVNRAIAKCIANGCNLGQQIRRNVVGGGIGGLVPAFAGGAVYNAPNAPNPRVPIRI